MIIFASEPEVVDAFDITESISKVDDLGVITKSEVDSLEVEAKVLFNAGDFKEAIPVLIEFSNKANLLANLISASIDPYYRASYDEKQKCFFSKYRPEETLAKEYKEKRNIALAMQGECLLKTGDKKGAIIVLLKALYLIDINNEIWWDRTQNNLFSIIEVDL